MVKGRNRMVPKEKGVPNLQVPDRNLQVREGEQDLDHQGCHPNRKLCKKKLRVAELRTEASFIKKKREAELQEESFRLEKEMAKAEARVKIYEQEKLEAKVRS